MTQLLSPWPDDDFDLYDEDHEPRVPVTLTPTQQADLVAALDHALRADGCDNTLRAAERWAHAARVPSWARLRRELEGNGGYCDCEILFTVFPDLPPVAPPLESR
ncbi:MAG: DUF2695 domain-containing protein [Pseudonocardia sp.]|nr:DUF2695 domain-containing protein [Pseudonocardia sp.]